MRKILCWLGFHFWAGLYHNPLYHDYAIEFEHCIYCHLCRVTFDVKYWDEYIRQEDGNTRDDYDR